jgi:DNA-binding transcriptional ArsR family regulator
MKNAGSIFKAISDPTRRRILQMLKDGPLSAGDIASEFDMSAPSVSRHLSTLKTAGLIDERRDGNRIIYSLESESLANCLSEFISSVCPLEQIEAKKRNKKR